MIRRVYANLEEIISVVLVSAVCIIVTLEVFYRLALNAPLSWTEEASTILFVWITMVGASLALKRGEHFSVELLHNMLPPAARRGARVLVALLLILFSVLLIQQGWGMARRNLHVLTPAMELPRAIPYSAVFGGGVLMLLRSTELLIRHARPGEVKP